MPLFQNIFTILAIQNFEIMPNTDTAKKKTVKIDQSIVRKGFELMCTAKTLSEKNEAHKEITSKDVYATARGHEAMQLALGMQLNPQDFVAPYYRDDSSLLGLGITHYELMLDLLANKDDPLSGGRTYYSHPSLNRPDMPKIPHPSSATGMQAIPMTGVAMGMQYKEIEGLSEDYNGENPVAVCSIGDAACTEGEFSEALQMAALKQLPILYLVQDNEWDISATADEIRAQDMAYYARGFKGIEVYSIDGSDFEESYNTIKKVLKLIRTERRPFLIHAKVPLLGHHTSGVRMEFYRDDLDEHATRDPYPKIKELARAVGIDEADLINFEVETKALVDQVYEEAKNAEDPDPASITDHYFAPTPITEEKGVREPKGKQKTVM